MSICLSNEQAAKKIERIQRTLEELHYWAGRVEDVELELYLAVAHDALDDALEVLDV